MALRASGVIVSLLRPPRGLSGIAIQVATVARMYIIGRFSRTNNARSGRPALVARLVVAVGLVGTTSFSRADSPDDRPSYRSPVDVAFSPDGSVLAAADPTWGGVVLIDPQKRQVVREVRLNGEPGHVIWNGNDRLLVSEGSTGTIAEVNAANGEVLRRLAAVRRATGLAKTSDGKTLLVCDRGLHTLAFLDLSTGAVARTVDVVREPDFIALTSDDKYAVVGNKLPRPEDARLTEHAAEVSVIEVSTGAVRNVRLPGGSSVVRQIAISPDNRWAYVIHQAGRANTMVTQLDKGWVMTNCTSIIDIGDASLYTTFIFDRDGAGAANPWGVAVSPDGSKLWATLAGISQLATVDLKALHALLEENAGLRATLHRDLQTMFAEDLLARRTVSSVEGTRGIAANPAGTLLAVAAYFEGAVLLIDTASEQIHTVAIGNNPAEDQVRMGERYYHSGLNCYQQWLSCATCHEGGRMDGLNWDLLNDGQGNPKNTRSHILSALTPPTNVTGCRENALVSSRAGYSNIEFQPAPEDRVAATHAYIQALLPEPSPYLGADGKLTPDAVDGKKIFESDEAGCLGCHRPPYFTDMHKYDVGTRLQAPLGPDNNSWDDAYDVPTLVELWRTAPYLHLGLAPTVKDVLVKENKNDRHGKTSHLSAEEIDHLAAYLLQIGPTEERASPQVDGGTAAPESDAAIPIPVKPTNDKAGTCICRTGTIGDARTRGDGYRTLLIGAPIVGFVCWRRKTSSAKHRSPP